MNDEIEELLLEVEELLYQLTNPERRISGKDSAKSIERYLLFGKFRRAVIRLLNELEKVYEEDIGEL